MKAPEGVTGTVVLLCRINHRQVAEVENWHNSRQVKDRTATERSQAFQ